MDTVVLISCAKRKRAHACAAGELYDPSPLFQCSLAYARTLDCPIYILSAKYGLVSLDARIAPYDATLFDMTEREKTLWASRVAEQLRQRFDLSRTRFILLAGQSYCGPLLPHLSHWELPLLGMRYGERIAALTAWCAPGGEADRLCDALHGLFQSLPRYRFDSIDRVPWDNGIYLMFEDGERYRGGERIVRVGTHSSDGRLKPRLRDHFLQPNKDGSIFRKNIGKAILQKNRHPYLPVWSADSRDKAEMRRQFGDAYDEAFQQRLELQISRYLQEHVSFTCFPVADAQARLRYEEGIIAALHRAAAFGPGESWRGRFSPVREIRESGLWLVQGLHGTPLRPVELEEITALCKTSLQIETKKAPKRFPQNAADFAEAPRQPGVQEVLSHLQMRLDAARRAGETAVTLRSGEIHEELGLKSRMPTVCAAMYKLCGPRDEILERPPKGKGSRLVIRYLL